MIESLKTVLKSAETEIIEKKSRFIANVAVVQSEEEAQAFIEKIRKKYRDARHNVFAYQVGEDNIIQRCSDDGEPSGTAGHPILDILISEGLKNIVIVVTRYFGGILLGTGGLVRAYSKAAKEGINEAVIIEKILYRKVSVVVDYSLSGKVKYETLQLKHIIDDIIYSSDVEFIILVKESQVKQFINYITEITNANSIVEEKENAWITKTL